MEDSFTERLLKQQKKNEDVLNNNNLTNTNLYDSSEYHPDQFGLGTFSGKVLEEIKEDHDNWENFMTTMFLIGIILIPLQMIFADKKMFRKRIQRQFFGIMAVDIGTDLCKFA